MQSSTQALTPVDNEKVTTPAERWDIQIPILHHLTNFTTIEDTPKISKKLVPLYK